MFTLVALNDTLWQHTIHFLVSSAPLDGAPYAVKCWILTEIAAPAHEVMYCMGLTTIKPASAMTTEDLLCALEVEPHKTPKT